MKKSILISTARYFSVLVLTLILGTVASVKAQSKADVSKAVQTAAFVNGKFALKPATVAQKTNKAIKHTVYVDLDVLTDGFLASYKDKATGAGVHLVAKPDGKVVAVQDGKELALRQFQFEYTGANPYWEELEKNDPTNGIFIK